MEVFFWLGVVVIILLAVKQAQEKKADPEAFQRKREAQAELGKKALKYGVETFLKKLNK